jgi:hypothetical protein
MNNILSGLPGCIGVGESHWIVDRVRNERQSGLCTECYQTPCPVFTDNVYELLGDESVLEAGEWWRVIAESADAEVIISADKRPRHFDRFGVPDKLLLMMKDPRSHIVSWCKRKFPPEEKAEVQAYHRGEAGNELTEDQFTTALNFWVRETRKHIDWCQAADRDLGVVSLESFVSDGEEVLSSIAEWMGVDNDIAALRFWETELHYIGSNHSVKRMRKDRHFFKTIKLDERWKQVLSDEQANRIMDDERVINLLERLKALSLDTKLGEFTT